MPYVKAILLLLWYDAYLEPNNSDSRIDPTPPTDIGLGRQEFVVAWKLGKL
jgi:hypothetical protein